MATPDPDRDLDADDEALRWAGDEEQGRAAPRLRGRDEDAAPAADADADEEEAPGARGRRAATIGFALPYLLLTAGWIFSVQLTSGPTDVAARVLWEFGEFLAMLVAPLWFAATLSLTRDSRPLVRVGWLALGLGMLLPWPVILRFLFALQVTGGLA